MKKIDSVTILQITNNVNTVYGLGSDLNIYQWNMLDSSWHMFIVEREVNRGGTPS